MRQYGDVEMEFKFSERDQIQLDVDEKMRPRAMRRLGIVLEWDQAIDKLPMARLTGLANILARICVLYRRVRPVVVGNRCAFEPSCSRYGEACFRMFGVHKGLVLTIARIRRCNSHSGGLDLPPGITDLTSLTERITR